MFELGKLTISEWTLKTVDKEVIYKNIEEYIRLANNYLFENDSLTEDQAIKRKMRELYEKNLLYRKEFFLENKLEMYIETYKENKGTFILSGEEYLTREIYNFAYSLNRSENDFLRVILNQCKEGTKYEINTSLRILNKLNDIENKKKLFKAYENV